LIQITGHQGLRLWLPGAIDLHQRGIAGIAA
jgi:hypothetical protein